jgi:hypothetical protein
MARSGPYVCLTYSKALKKQLHRLLRHLPPDILKVVCVIPGNLSWTPEHIVRSTYSSLATDQFRRCAKHTDGDNWDAWSHIHISVQSNEELSASPEPLSPCCLAHWKAVLPRTCACLHKLWLSTELASVLLHFKCFLRLVTKRAYINFNGFFLD